MFGRRSWLAGAAVAIGAYCRYLIVWLAAIESQETEIDPSPSYVDVHLLCSPTCSFCGMAIDSLETIKANTVRDLRVKRSVMAWTHIDRQLGALSGCLGQAAFKSLVSEVQSHPGSVRRGDTFELMALAARLGQSRTGLAACVDERIVRWARSESNKLLGQFTDTISPTFVVGDSIIYGLQSMTRLLRAVEATRREGRR